MDAHRCTAATLEEFISAFVVYWWYIVTILYCCYLHIGGCFIVDVATFANHRLYLSELVGG